MEQGGTSKCPWVLVAGDFNQTGGIDRANYHLAWYLAENLGHPVHVVAHPRRAAAVPCQRHPSSRDASVRQALPGRNLPRPHWPAGRGQNSCPEPGDAHPRQRRQLQLARPQLGPLCTSRVSSPGHRRAVVISLRRRWIRWHFQQSERRIVGSARVVIANWDVTRSQLIELLKLPAERVHRIYLGVDPRSFPCQAPTNEPGAGKMAGRRLGLGGHIHRHPGLQRQQRVRHRFGRGRVAAQGSLADFGGGGRAAGLLAKAD